MKVRTLGLLLATAGVSLGSMFAAPAFATSCSAQNLACATNISLTGHSHGCSDYFTTQRRCDVSFHAQGSCSAVLGGTCTASLSSDVGGDADNCTIPINGSCSVPALDTFGTVYFAKGTTLSVCGNLKSPC